MTVREWFRVMRGVDWEADPIAREWWCRHDYAVFFCTKVFYHHELITLVDAITRADPPFVNVVNAGRIIRLETIDVQAFMERWRYDISRRDLIA